jgi:hypothetical protein
MSLRFPVAGPGLLEQASLDLAHLLHSIGVLQPARFPLGNQTGCREPI